LKNPTYEVYKEVSHTKAEGNHNVSMIISLGTGLVRGIEKRSRGLNLFSPAQFYKSSPELILGSSQSVDRTMLEIRTKKRISYFRFDGPEYPHDRVGDSIHEISSSIRKSVEEYLSLEGVQEELKHCARILVDRRRQRTLTSQWISFPRHVSESNSIGIHNTGRDTPCQPRLYQSGNRLTEIRQKQGLYRCTMPLCPLPSDNSFSRREDFLVHLIIAHQKPPPDAAHSKSVNDMLDSGYMTMLQT